MNAQALIIDAELSEIQVGPSALELHNIAEVNRGLANNRSVREQRKVEAGKILRRDAEVGAEYIVRQRDRTRTTKLDEVRKHYFGN
jgi:hypothetical protein